MPSAKAPVRVRGGHIQDWSFHADSKLDPQPATARNCHEHSVLDRDRQAAIDVGTSLGMTIGDGSRLRLDTTKLIAMRGAFSRGETRRACIGCEWADLCDGVAGGGYLNTLLNRADA